MEDLIGWGSGLVLLPTFGVQVYQQWERRDDPLPPLALWFFILALVGTGGQVIYSYLVGNKVYLTLNCILVLTNGLGLAIAIRRKALKGSATPAQAEAEG